MKSQSKAMEVSANASKSQAESSKRATKIAEETLHIVEAADIEPDMTICSTVPQPLSTKTEITHRYRNTGRTRAEDVDTALFVGIPELAGKEPRGFRSKGSIGAGQTFSSGPVFVGKALNEHGLALVNEGFLEMHLWGWTTYKDVFGVQHRVDFDAVSVPKTQCNFKVIRTTSH